MQLNTYRFRRTIYASLYVAATPVSFCQFHKLPYIQQHMMTMQIITKGCYIAHLVRPGLHYVGAKWLNARACYLTSLRALLIYALLLRVQRSPSGSQMRLLYGLLQRHRFARGRAPFWRTKKTTLGLSNYRFRASIAEAMISMRHYYYFIRVNFAFDVHCTGLYVCIIKNEISAFTNWSNLWSNWRKWS